MINEQFRNINVIGREGRQIYLQDDDKVCVELDPKKNRNINIDSALQVKMKVIN